MLYSRRATVSDTPYALMITQAQHTTKVLGLTFRNIIYAVNTGKPSMGRRSTFYIITKSAKNAPFARVLALGSYATTMFLII
jgi:hypothetical protein